MKLKEILLKAGSVSDYLGYIILLFAWNSLTNLIDTSGLESSGVVYQGFSWVLRLLVGPILLAIVYSGIYERQTIQNELERRSFLSHIKTYALRFIAAYFLSLSFYYLVTVIGFFVAGEAALTVDRSNLFLLVLSASSSTLILFWYSALVVEPKLFRSLFHSIRTALFNPVALAITLVWSVICIADSVSFDFNPEQIPLAVNFARAGVFAILKTLAVMYILVIYKNDWGKQIQREQAAEILTGLSTPRPGEGLAKVSLGFSFFSFIPLAHLVALALGMASLNRSRRFILKAATACSIGGFFTILYVLVTAGYLIGQNNINQVPDYSFLASDTTEGQPYVDLLKQGAYEDIQLQLDHSSASQSPRDWRIDTALALAKYQNNDLDGALKAFYSALQKEPARSEFYFYYGLALLDNDNTEMAMQQFRLAIDHQPKLQIAEAYVGLVQNMYQPTVIESALMYLVILFFLFTVHEYGHAFAAWKLGDDTAMQQGRLTLNPIAHLDLFGSIILPAMLLLQQSGMLFGWARPVPVDTRNLKNPEKDHMLISFAGPAVNLLVAMITMLILVLLMLLTRLFWPETLSLNLVSPYSGTSIIGPPFTKALLVFIVFLKQLFYTSLILGFLNLVPIPPLDGSWILAGFLPEGLRGIFDYVRRFGFILFILLALTPVFDIILGVPVGIAWVGLSWIVSTMGFV